MERSDPLVTFARIPPYLEHTGRAFTLAPDADLLQLRFEDPRCSALVAMRAITTRAGSEWLALSVPICPTDRIRPRSALVCNDELPIGALADWQGTMLLRQTLPMRSTSFLQLEQVLHALVYTSTALVAAAGSAEPSQVAGCGYLFR